MFNIRRFDSIAVWERAYDREGAAGLMPHQRSPRERKSPDCARTPLPDSDGAELPSREELLQELEALRTENAYLKKVKALVQSQANSALSSVNQDENSASIKMRISARAGGWRA